LGAPPFVYGIYRHFNDFSTNVTNLVRRLNYRHSRFIYWG